MKETKAFDIPKHSKSLLNALWLASRPRTWPAGLSPVFIGTSLAYFEGPISFSLLFLTLLFALSIQIGTNFANDAFDFQKGADTGERIGPPRATRMGWLPQKTVFKAAYTIFGFALLLSLFLILRAGVGSLALAAICVLFGILYTGGPKPLGYIGLGETLVFIFFGPVAVLGTFYLQRLYIEPKVFIASIAPGLLSCAILIANNMRDELTDRKANKKTLIVLFGRLFGAYEYMFSILLAFLTVPILVHGYNYPAWLYLSCIAFIPFITLIKRSFCFKSHVEIVPHLPITAMLLLVYTLIFCIALIINLLLALNP